MSKKQSTSSKSKAAGHGAFAPKSIKGKTFQTSRKTGKTPPFGVVPPGRHCWGGAIWKPTGRELASNASVQSNVVIAQYAVERIKKARKEVAL